MLTEEQIILRAEARATAKMRFYSHLAGYVLLNAFMMTMNWWLSGRVNWAFWVLLGTTLGIGKEAIQLYFQDGEAHQRLVAKEADAIRRREQP